MSENESTDPVGESILQESDKDELPSLSKTIGKIKARTLEKIRQGAFSSLPYFNQVKQFTPVYKIMITVPVLKGGSVTPYRYILADTSRPTLNFLSGHDSPVVGMWVDQSDLTEPDKAIVLIQNPVTIIDKIFEQDMLQFHQFGVRNWLDVWMGYIPATIQNIISLGTAVPFLRGIFPDELISAPFTAPDPFLFGNDSHIFSGPIVSVKRSVDATGDRLQIIGFSPAMVLKQVTTRTFKIDADAGPTIHECIDKVANAVFPIDIKDVGKKANYPRFGMGRFPFAMFSGGGSKIRVVPVNWGREVHGPALPIWTYKFSNADYDLVGTRLKEKKIRITLEGNSSLYDILFADLTTAAYTRIGRVYAFIQRAKGKDNPEWAFTGGEGHPGVFIKYGFAHEISGIRKMVKKKAYSPHHIQSLTLGRNCREFEGGVEYGTVFNVREFMVRMDPKKAQNEFVQFPIDFLNGKIGGTEGGLDGEIPPSLTSEHYEPHSDLWEALKYDIEVYGPSKSPLRKWIWGDEGGAVALAGEGVANFIANSMRDTYFTGFSGSVFAIGDPSLQPGRILSLTDGRGELSKYSISELTKRGISKGVKSFKERLNIKDPEEPATPKMFRMRNMDKDFYIWKVRHYLGVGSGYVSKVYYTEERNRSWQKHTESIDAIIRKALMQSKYTMAGAGRV